MCIYIYICQLQLAQGLDRISHNFLRKPRGKKLKKMDFFFESFYFEFHGQRRALELVHYINNHITLHYNYFYLNIIKRWCYRICHESFKSTKLGPFLRNPDYTGVGVTEVSMFKGTISVISSYPPCKLGNALYTAVPLKALSDQV